MSAAEKQQQLTWPQVIDQAAPQFNEIATKHQLVTWAEESQFAKQAIEKSNQLAQCSVRTVQNSIVNVAAIGLTLNPALGYAYLVPEGKECSLKVSFKGLMKIATDSGSIKWAKAEVVKEKDTFNYRGPCEKPEHIMQPFGDRGKTVGVYCIAKTHEGDYLVDIMDAGEIAKIKAAAKTKNVWNAWEDEMAKKAIIKRSSKQWPKTEQSERFDHAIAVVNEYEGSEDITKERDITPAKPEQREKMDISDDRLEKAIKRINAGEYSIKRLTDTFKLTPAQISKVQSDCDLDGDIR